MFLILLCIVIVIAEAQPSGIANANSRFSQVQWFPGVPHNVAVLVPKLTGLRVAAEAGDNLSDEHVAIHSLKYV